MPGLARGSGLLAEVLFFCDVAARGLGSLVPVTVFIVCGKGAFQVLRLLVKPRLGGFGAAPLCFGRRQCCLPGRRPPGLLFCPFPLGCLWGRFALGTAAMPRSLTWSEHTPRSPPKSSHACTQPPALTVLLAVCIRERTAFRLRT